MRHFGLPTLVAAVGMMGAPALLLGQAADPKAVTQPSVVRLERATRLDGPGCALAFNPELESLAVGTERGSVQLWDRDVLYGVRSGERTSTLLQAHTGAVTALASRGRYLATSGTDRRLCLWSLPEGKLEHTITTETIQRSLAFAPDGKTLAAAGEDGAVALLEVPSLKALAKLTGHTNWVTALAFRADGQQLAAGAYDGQVGIWDVSSQQRLVTIVAQAPAVKDQPSVENTVLTLAWSIDGATLAVGGTDRRIHVFRAVDGEYQRSLTGHNGAVTALAYDPNGNILASAAKDRTVRIWKTADATSLATLEGHTAWVEALAFVGQGTRLVSAGADRTLRFWSLSVAHKK